MRNFSILATMVSWSLWLLQWANEITADRIVNALCQGNSNVYTFKDTRKRINIFAFVITQIRTGLGVCYINTRVPLGIPETCQRRCN